MTAKDEDAYIYSLIQSLKISALTVLLAEGGMLKEPAEYYRGLQAGYLGAIQQYIDPIKISLILREKESSSERPKGGENDS